MSLIEHLGEGILRVRWVRAGSIAVDAHTFESSFILSPQQLVPGWAPRSVEQLDEPAIQALLDLQPELVLLGTGARQHFPRPAVLAAFLRRQIGVEVMDNAAAARTYDLLAQEGRRVVVGFLLGDPAA